MKLSTCLIRYFCEYLPQIKGLSKLTIVSYRNTFSLFLPFAAQYFSIKIQSLQITHLTQDVTLAFLNYIENQRNNVARTRNTRLAAIKSFSRMIRLLYPDHSDLVDTILKIPKKKEQKKFIGFLYPDEILKVLKSVNITKHQGFRDYTILHLLYDSGARASEIADLNIDYFDARHKTLAILGKGNRYRLINISPKTVQLIRHYIIKYRTIPNPIYQNFIFINQRGKKLTRHGLYRICRLYLSGALPEKRVKNLNSVGCFRHSMAVNMLSSGHSPDEIKYRLGHQHINSTMAYLRLDIYKPREIHKELIDYTNSIVRHDPKIDDLLDWENKNSILAWLDRL